MTSLHHPHPHHHIPKPSSAPAATASSAAAQACAACKYQRRKCAPDCILAPFFPHDRQRQFLNAHKLFGVSNITKIIKNLDPLQKEEAMRTIIYQSDVRASDPVGGCYRIVQNLHRQIATTHAELQIVHHHLAICKHQAAAALLEPDHLHHHHHHLHPVTHDGFDGIDPHGIQFVDPHPHQGGFQQDHDHQDIIEVVWPGIHDSGMSSSSSSLHLEQQPGAGAVSVHDFHDQPHLLKFHDQHHHLLDHHSEEEGMLKMDNVMLNESSEAIQQAQDQDQDQDLKGLPAISSSPSFRKGVSERF